MRIFCVVCKVGFWWGDQFSFFTCSLVLHNEFKSSDHQRLVFNYSRVDQLKNKKTEGNNIYWKLAPSLLLIFFTFPNILNLEEFETCWVFCFFSTLSFKNLIIQGLGSFNTRVHQVKNREIEGIFVYYNLTPIFSSSLLPCTNLDRSLHCLFLLFIQRLGAVV